LTTTEQLPLSGLVSATRKNGGYLPGIDGLRAIAVAAVLFYHQDLGWARGGFLGVEVFFVVSGFLITSLLLREWDRTGAISLRAFWTRRARRLLPALVVMLAVVFVLGSLFVPDAAKELRGDTAAALTYVANWWMVFHHQSYFAHMGRPPLLQHLWSLAVEEQFYLLWPLVLVLAMRWFRRGRRAVLALAVGGAALSLTLMGLLAQPFTDNSRVYYGTDTRGAGLLIGAALAVVLAGPGLARVQSVRARAVVQVAAIAGLGVLAWAVSGISYYDPGLYPGGFLLVDLATAAVIIGVLNPRYALSRLLGWRPLRWIGLRSYSIYLWHWPVFMVTRAHLDIALGGLPLLVVRLVLTLSLADFSYRLVERRVRTRRGVSVPGSLPELGPDASAWPASPDGAVGAEVGAEVGADGPVGAEVGADGWVGGDGPANPAPRDAHPLRLRPAGIAMVASWLLVVFIWPTTHGVPLSASSVLLGPGSPPSPVSAVVGPAASDDIDPLAWRRPRPWGPATTAPAVVPFRMPLTVTAIGDSVMLDAMPALQRAVAGIDVDAMVGRQFVAGLADVSARLGNGHLGQEVIVGLGTNGPIAPTQFDAMLQLLRGRRVVVVNVHVARPWESEVNTVFAAGVQRWPNVTLVDWYTFSLSHPELFTGDGIHLQPAAGAVYAEMVTRAL
jgi:peptidoglycan/LPS O-acetylase OafA/YrhL